MGIAPHRYVSVVYPFNNDARDGDEGADGTPITNPLRYCK